MKIKTNFKYLADREFDQFAIWIHKNMKNNPNFPTPPVPIADLEAAITLYVDCLSKVKRGTAQDIIDKNNAKIALGKILNDYALYVQLTAGDNASKLTSSGFELIKPRNPVGILPKPQNFGVKVGQNLGSMELSLNTIAGAHAYVYECTEYPRTHESIWVSHTDTKSKATIHNLVSGKKYVFRAAGVGAYPILVYSEEITSYVL